MSRRLLLAVVALLPAAAWAQRNGDVSNGMDNQPTGGEVRSREKAAGVAPPPAQQRQQTDEVGSIYRQLMSREPAAGGTPAPGAPPLQPAPVAR